MGRRDGQTDGRTRRRLYAPPKFFREHNKLATDCVWHMVTYENSATEPVWFVMFETVHILHATAQFRPCQTIVSCTRIQHSTTHVLVLIITLFTQFWDRFKLNKHLIVLRAIQKSPSSPSKSSLIIISSCLLPFIINSTFR